MFKYLKSLYENIQINSYNYFNSSDKTDKKYPRLSLEEDECQDIINTYTQDEKQMRIDTLLFVRQYKNTYYKYTNKSKFNPELYNSFTDEKNFDGGQTGYDDDDINTKIFDKYIIEYIKNRNDLLTHLQCKNKEISLKTTLDTLNNCKKNEPNLDALFIMDMSEKDLFLYIFSIVQEKKNISIIKSLMFSVIFKHDSEYIRVKLSAFSKNKQNHPYLILESIL